MTTRHRITLTEVDENNKLQPIVNATTVYLYKYDQSGTYTEIGQMLDGDEANGIYYATSNGSGNYGIKYGDSWVEGYEKYVAIDDDDAYKLLDTDSEAIDLNKLDGTSATTADFNKLASITSTAAELNKLDGISSSVVVDDFNTIYGLNSFLGTYGDSLITFLGKCENTISDCDTVNYAGGNGSRWQAGNYIGRTDPIHTAIAKLDTQLALVSNEIAGDAINGIMINIYNYNNIAGSAATNTPTETSPLFQETSISYVNKLILRNCIPNNCTKIVAIFDAYVDSSTSTDYGFASIDINDTSITEEPIDTDTDYYSYYVAGNIYTYNNNFVKVGFSLKSSSGENLLVRGLSLWLCDDVGANNLRIAS